MLQNQCMKAYSCLATNTFTTITSPKQNFNGEACYCLSFSGSAAFAPAPMGKTSSVMNAFTVADLPGDVAPVGFFDPLGFAEKADEKTLKCYRKKLR